MLGTVFAGAFVWEIGYNTQMNKLWDSMNRGVRLEQPDRYTL